MIFPAQIVTIGARIQITHRDMPNLTRDAAGGDHSDGPPGLLQLNNAGDFQDVLFKRKFNA